MQNDIFLRSLFLSEIQETPESIPEGETPSTIDVYPGFSSDRKTRFFDNILVGVLYFSPPQAIFLKFFARKLHFFNDISLKIKKSTFFLDQRIFSQNQKKIENF